MNDQELKVLEDSVIIWLQGGVIDYLKTNPMLKISDIAVSMVSNGMHIKRAATLTGVPEEEIDRLQNIRH